MPPTGQTSQTPFGQWLARRGKKLKDLQHKSTAMRLSAKPEEVATNSPMLDLIAKELGVDVDQIRAFAKGPPMSDVWLAKVHTQMKNAGAHGSYYKKGRHKGAKKLAKQGKRASGGTVLGSVEVTARERPESTNGKKSKSKALVKHTKHATEKHTEKQTPAQYNRLKKGSAALRQSARTIVGTFNIAIMRGDTMMPQVPLGDVYLILHDWLAEKGVAGALVNPRFSELFDRKF
ncbi:MAG TPA: hypothetical protein VJN70_12550 [Gemmatimonadaceae bacterium]|nr:hypothetical protein [Gemmatimonadaceae bacterium]